MRAKSSRNERRDANESNIVDILKRAGATVERLAPRRGEKGLPDLLVGYRGVNYLLEVKSEGGNLSPSQCDWIARWRGEIQVVRSAAKALKVIGAIRKL